MKKYDLLRQGDTILRVLELRQEKAMVLDCIKRRMPVWVDATSLDGYSSCTMEELMLITAAEIVSVDDMDAAQRKTMHERYAMIAPILPFVADVKVRSQVLSSIAEKHSVSKQTIRSCLCLYLSYMDMAVLAPKGKAAERALSQDEKNMRWALNKYFYTRSKLSLTTVYTLMLKEKYCDPIGNLLGVYPSFYQFRYFYRKTRNLQNYYISRDGLTNYQRNHRPLTGNGVQEFATAVGVGMLDSTVCDIYLINETGSLVGRPILTACVDAYSGLCCGYSLSWEGGVYSLRGLMMHVITDKKAWCERFGIVIDAADWNCDKLPGTLVTDMGSEYTSSTFEQIAELGVTVVNLPPYRPELKGVVEKFFDLIQETYKKQLKGTGIVEPDYRERGVQDYRKEACFTMEDFEKIILHCIVYYNSKRIVENFPYTEEMLANHIKPHASAIWNFGLSQPGTHLLAVCERDLIYALLPRTMGKFARDGLRVNKLRYHCEGYTERYLTGGSVTVVYNPEDVTSVWLLEKGQYIEFTLIEAEFLGKNLTDVQEIQDSRRNMILEAKEENLQARIDLAQHMETIVHGISNGGNVNLKNIRHTRKREQNRKHRDYLKKGDSHE